VNEIQARRKGQGGIYRKNLVPRKSKKAERRANRY